jgi:hypothetical protein
MIKIKNITKENILFVDIEGNKTMIEPGKEIQNELPAAFGYSKKLQISGVEEKPIPKQEEKKPEVK